MQLTQTETDKPAQANINSQTETHREKQDNQKQDRQKQPDRNKTNRNETIINKTDRNNQTDRQTHTHTLSGFATRNSKRTNY